MRNYLQKRSNSNKKKLAKNWQKKKRTHEPKKLEKQKKIKNWLKTGDRESEEKNWQN